MRRTRASGFTLVELLVAMAIIGTLIALLLPAVQSTRESARRIQCQNQLRQLGLALHNYHDVHSRFPAGSLVRGPSFATLSGWGWGAMVLPHMEQTPLYQQLDFNIGTAVGVNVSTIAISPTAWRCPSEVEPERMTVFPLDRAPLTIASGNYCGSEGILSEVSSTRIADIPDGTSQTLLLGERMIQPSRNGSLPQTSGWFGQIAYPDGYEYRSLPHLAVSRLHPINASMTDPLCFSSHHASGAVFTFADGSTRLLSDSIDVLLFEALGTPRSSEVIGEF